MVTNMKASIIKIGNSQGIRIPKPIIEQCGFENEVELEVHDHELIIKSSRTPRQDWETAFKGMAANGDDQLLDSATKTKWDEEEWEW
jgi:antitoxin MazE